MFWIWLIFCIALIIGLISAVRVGNKILTSLLVIVLIAMLIGFIVVLLPGIMFAFSDWQF